MTTVLTRLALIVALLTLAARPVDAALVDSSLGGACDTANNTVFVTASISPTNGSLILLAVVVTSETTATGVTGAGLTWTQVTSANVTFDTTGTPTSRLQIFQGAGTPSAGALTITAGGVTSGMCWKAFEFSGQHAVTPIVQAVAGSGNAQTTFTSTLAAFGSVSNWTLWIVGFSNGSGATHVAEGSFRTVGAVGRITMATPNYSLGALVLESNDTTPSSSSDTSSNYGGIGLEIAPADVAARQCLGSMMGTGC